MGIKPLLDQHTDLISFKVFIDGKELGDDYHVVLIEVEKHINKLPYARIEILDGDPSKQKLEALEKLKIEPGQDVKVDVGYHQDDKTIFEGIVSGVGFNSKQDRHGRTIVECTDKCVGLTLTKDNEYFVEKKDSAIVQQLVNTYDNIEVDVDDTNTIHKKIVQYNTSDWDFIISRASVCERIVVADRNKLKFVKAGGDTTVDLEYGSELIKIDIKLDARSQRKSIELKGWNPSDHRFESGSSSDPSYVEKNGSSATQGSKLADKMQFKDEVIYVPSTLESDELKDIAKSKLLHSRLSKYQGKLVLQGVSDVDANTYAKLVKTNEMYDGDVYITGVKHTIEEGNFQTEAYVGLDDDAFSGSDGGSSGKGATPDNLGLMPGPKGLFIGEVTKMDGDPAGDFRIQVKIPTFNEDDEGLWARLSGPSASEDSGFIWYPEVGDQVIVGFLMNDPRFPVILGSLYSKKFSVFDDHQPASGNNQKAIVTREHMKILFEEDKKDITITTPGDNFMKFSDNDKSIEIKDEHGNFIKMSNKGIEIYSIKDVKVDAKSKIIMKAVSDFTAEGMKLELTAKSSGKFKANSSLKLDGGSSSELKALTTNVKGSVMLNLN